MVGAQVIDPGSTFACARSDEQTLETSDVVSS